MTLIKSMHNVTRKTPYQSELISRKLLNNIESHKRIYELCFGYNPEIIQYRTGDCIGILPKNPTDIVNHLIKNKSCQTIQRKNKTHSLFNYLSTQVNLITPSKKATIYLNDKNIQYQFPLWKTLSMLDENIFFDLLPILKPLQPRLYSIASSPKQHYIRLVVDHLYDADNIGICSNFLCDELEIGDSVELYVHKTRDFLLEPSQNIVMIATGTGIAPFIGFTEELIELESTHNHLLFFGTQTKQYDYIYENFWNNARDNINISIYNAFSRDQKNRYYVQNALIDKKELVIDHIINGSIFYICGSIRMGIDVINTLDILIQQYKLNISTTELKKSKRIRMDTY